MHVTTAIVGAGFSGLGLGIRLTQSGMSDFLIFERASDVGGTWRDNTYPGCACDVQSHLYSFSFALNPAWTRLYSPQLEIQAYLRACVDRFSLHRHLKLEHEVTAARWNAARCHWQISTSHGDYTADTLVLAPGPLSEPKIPAIPGLNLFKGAVFHSARWNHAIELRGRSVAVVGTGASAIQFIPIIQPQVQKLLIVQRTPPWVIPRRDRAIAPWQRHLLASFPAMQRWLRLQVFLLRELRGALFRAPRLLRLTQRCALRHMHAAITSPMLRTKLTPQYTLGCKRVLVSDDYYPALAQANVNLAATSLASVKEDAVVLADGTEHRVDTIIFGTGFYVTDMPHAAHILGRGGQALGAIWSGSPKAHLGTTVARFPNLFLLLGPNTGLGHSSVILMVEAQIEHILGALKFKRTKSLATIEPRQQAQAAFIDAVDHQSRGTVWKAGGCDSWYLDATGRNSSLWPGSVGAFKRRVARFRPEDYDYAPKPAER